MGEQGRRRPRRVDRPAQLVLGERARRQPKAFERVAVALFDVRVHQLGIVSLPRKNGATVFSRRGSPADTRTAMLKRSVLAMVLLPLVVSGLTSSTASATSSPYRPDAWIKLCGESTGCTINPPP